MVLCATALGGCYELQAARGQATLLWRRQPIASLIDAPQTPAALRKQLREVAAIRQFASRDLGLPDNGSYRSYVDLGRPYAVWNVFAAPRFSLSPRLWCFPVVGCVAYRGYFALADAQAFAARLRAQGFDVAVRGAAAYSTLGFFDDPIVSTMLGWRRADLAGIVFHELTHQLLYVPGDAPFNEALATLVEEEGVIRWLQSQSRDAELRDYLTAQQRRAELIDLWMATRRQLQALYGGSASAAVMEERKQAAFAALRSDYQVLRAGWGGYAGFDGWMAEELNNAQFASIATYHSCLPGLRRELRAVGSDLPAFYRRARELARLPKPERDGRVCDAAPDASG